MERITYSRNTLSERTVISSEARPILDDLFEGGSYTLTVMSDEWAGRGIDIEVDARLNGYRIKANCVCMPEEECGKDD